MKKITTILGFMLISSTVFASDMKLESYDCGLQVGKSLNKLAGSTAAKDITNLAEDLSNFASQTKLASQEKDEDYKLQISQAANSSWQSIIYSIKQIKSVSADEAKAIETACDL